MTLTPQLQNASRWPGWCGVWESDTSLLLFLHDRSHIRPTVEWAVDFFQEKKIHQLDLTWIRSTVTFICFTVVISTKRCGINIRVLLCKRFEFWNCLATNGCMKQPREDGSRPNFINYYYEMFTVWHWVCFVHNTMPDYSQCSTFLKTKWGKVRDRMFNRNTL